MPPYLAAGAVAYAALLAESCLRQCGRVIPEDAEALWRYPLPLVSHGTEADPIFRYGNLAALTLWQMEWDAFTRLPSRLSAQPDPDIQSERAGLLAAALARGHVEGYAGVRISARGQRFRIEDTLLWTVTDADGQRQGQAALIGRVTRL